MGWNQNDNSDSMGPRDSEEQAYVVVAGALFGPAAAGRSKV